MSKDKLHNQTVEMDEDIYIREEDIERVDIDDVPPKPWVVFKDNFMCCYLCETFRRLNPKVELEELRLALVKFSDQHRNCVQTCKIIHNDHATHNLKVSDDDLSMAVLSAASLYVTWANRAMTRADSLKFFHPKFGKFVLSLVAADEVKVGKSSIKDPEKDRFTRSILELRSALKKAVGHLNEYEHSYSSRRNSNCSPLTSVTLRQRWAALANRDSWWLTKDNIADKAKKAKAKAKKRRR